jgi:hypothetical protein
VSRKTKRKKGAPPGRETGVGEKSQPWAFVLGIFLAFLTLCLGTATLRQIYIGLHQNDYVRDELVVSSVSSLDDEATLHGQIASSGETVSVPLGVAGADYDRFREMQRDGRIKGQRVPVWYLPQETPWWLSGNNQVRVLNVSQFEDHFGGWRTGVAITVPLAFVSVFLLLYGIKQIRSRRGAPAT